MKPDQLPCLQMRFLASPRLPASQPGRDFSYAAGGPGRRSVARHMRLVGLISLLASAMPASATECGAAFTNGSAQLLCTEPGKANSQCDFGLEVKLEGGSATVIKGKFTISKGAKDQLVFQATQAGGKRIVGVGKATTKICSPTK